LTSLNIDWHTRERIPARTQWEVWIDRLIPTRDVQDVEDPLLITGELEAIVRSCAGRIASLTGDLDRAASSSRLRSMPARTATLRSSTHFAVSSPLIWFDTTDATKP